ncbi:MAG: hypothetical protein ABIG95_03660 [Candidatus Woesearchaeota archaeon]
MTYLQELIAETQQLCLFYCDKIASQASSLSAFLEIISEDPLFAAYRRKRLEVLKQGGHSVVDPEFDSLAGCEQVIAKNLEFIETFYSGIPHDHLTQINCPGDLYYRISALIEHERKAYDVDHMCGRLERISGLFLLMQTLDLKPSNAPAEPTCPIRIAAELVQKIRSSVCNYLATGENRYHQQADTLIQTVCVLGTIYRANILDRIRQLEDAGVDPSNLTLHNYQGTLVLPYLAP